MTIKHLKENGLIIFEAIMGSRAYGTSLPTSDTDIRGVFIQPLDDILGFGYIDQVSDDTNDTVYYEIRRFLQLVQTNNPNILELLNAPAECILHKNPVFDLVLEDSTKFLSKQCKNSFAGYAIQQIRKAKGYNKKINWEEQSMTRKNILEFCYILDNGSTKLFNTWLKENYKELDYKDFGLANVDHAHDIYAMYRMYPKEHYKDELPNTDNHTGIVKDPEQSKDVQLCSIPKGRPIIGYLTFNKDAYSIHCKRFKEYQTWLNNRNEDRFKMNKEHGKNYDSKNMMHTFRLLNMASEIANGEINVRRSDEERKILMSIRKGDYDYEKLIEDAENLIKLMDDNFDKSQLPDKIDKQMVDELLIKIRKEFYGLQ